MRVWLAPWVAGLKELEELGRECDLPRKRMVPWLVGVVYPHVFHGVRCKRLRFCDESLGFGAHGDKRGRFSSDERVSFPREGFG